MTNSWSQLRFPLITNRKSNEIHKSDCYWVSLMNDANKVECGNLEELIRLLRDNSYNGCFFCLPRYDADTLTAQQVLTNIEEDLAEAAELLKYLTEPHGVWEQNSWSYDYEYYKNKPFVCVAVPHIKMHEGSDGLYWYKKPDENGG